VPAIIHGKGIGVKLDQVLNPIRLWLSGRLKASDGIGKKSILVVVKRLKILIIKSNNSNKTKPSL